MPARINLNIESLAAQRNLGVTNLQFQKSVERISSGLRINRAADDAAGLTISEKLRAQFRGLDQAVRNSQDGISLIQTGEGALNEVHDLLQRMRELSVQGGNDTLNSIDRESLKDELTQLRIEIDRIANVTQFNNKKLLQGSQTFQFQIGANTETLFEALQVNPISTTTVIIGSATLAGAANLSTAVNQVSSAGATGGAAEPAGAHDPELASAVGEHEGGGEPDSGCGHCLRDERVRPQSDLAAVGDCDHRASEPGTDPGAAAPPINTLAG